MLFLQYPPCSTCQKAKKWLDDHGIEYTARHIKEDKPTADKLPTMTEDEQLALLASDGMLVKRPLLVGDDFVLPGFKQAEWENALL